MRLNAIIDFIGLLIPILCLITSIILVVANLKKLNKIEPLHNDGNLDENGRNVYDPETESGKSFILEQKLFFKIISFSFASLLSTGFLIQVIQLFYFSSSVETDMLTKEINNHGDLIYINKPIYEIGVALIIIGCVGFFLSNIVGINILNKRK